jgi:hypothetical protein
MDTAAIVAIIIIVALALIVLAAVWFFRSRRNNRRSQEFRERFGPEYEDLRKARGRRKAERELEQRQQRVDKLRLKELEPQQRSRFAGEWQDVQSKFVDDPGSAILDADVLVQRVMNARGYPMGDFERRAADISVDHPEIVRNYRAAHDISEASRRGGSDTENQRRGMLHYRALFGELLESKQRAVGSKRA